MSRTIITKSGSEFFTNISSENFLGEICKDIGGKFFMTKYGTYENIVLAYNMTKKEVLYVSNALKIVANIESELEMYCKKYEHYFGGDVKIEEFKDSLLYYADKFEKSDGYECAN